MPIHIPHSAKISYDVDQIDLFKFFAGITLHSVLCNSYIPFNSHWTDPPLNAKNTAIIRGISLQRYKYIFKCISYIPSAKLVELQTRLVQSSIHFYEPSSGLSFDELMRTHKGKRCRKCYRRKVDCKPHPIGLWFYILNASSGYYLFFELYRGGEKETLADLVTRALSVVLPL